jgi:hypothetical protein
VQTTAVPAFACGIFRDPATFHVLGGRQDLDGWRAWRRDAPEIRHVKDAMSRDIVSAFEQADIERAP